MPIAKNEVTAPFGAVPLSYGLEVGIPLEVQTIVEERADRARKKKEAADERRRRADEADREIFEQVALERSEQAFSELYDRYSPRVYSMMLHYFRVEEDALDILQDTMLLLWEKAPQLYRENTNVRAAIIHFARNCAMDALRARKRRKLDIVDLTEDQPRLEELMADDHTPEYMLHAKEARKQVRDALLALTPIQRTAIDLAYFGGLSREEIAVRLGIHKDALQSQILRGMRKLRSVLRPQFSAPEEKITIQVSKRELKKDLVSIIPYGRD